MEPHQPPERFGVVEAQVYRSSVFHPVNFTFISTLRLKTIVHLSPGKQAKRCFSCNNFLNELLGLTDFK